MPKRSLNTGNGGTKKIEQLNQSIDKMFARTNSVEPKTSAEIEPLVRIAAELRNLPSASFKARLKSELGGKNRMSTVAEPVAAVGVSASARMVFQDPARAIELYKQAFGATEKFRFVISERDLHAEILIGDSTVHISGEWPEGNRFSAETLGNSPIYMSIQVPDVDAFAERAAAAGMKIIRPVKDQFYGRRDVTMTDPFGYTWVAFKVLEQVPVEELHRRMAKLGPEGGRTKPASSVDPVPRGFRMVTPYLVAEDGFGLLDFVIQAFGAEETLRIPTPTGVHGEVRIGDSAMMIGGGKAGQKFPSTTHPNALHVYVESTDEVTKRAVAAGATLLDAPRDQDYGERSSTVKDAAGNFWYIATAQGESYLPKGLHNVNPYLHPRRAEPLIGFLKRAFGAQEVAKYASPDGVVHHAVVRVGDSVIEMGEAHDKYGNMPAMFYLYVPDCDAVYRRALAAGAKSLHDLTDQPYGDRNGAVTDDFGNTWYIATHVKDVEP
jgi:PhnB protein